MSELEVLIPITFFVFMLIILSKMMKYRHERKRWEMMRGQQENAEQSLTTSELQLMIEDAVARATAPIEDRLASLERPLLDIGESDEPVEKTLGREKVR